MCQVLLTISGFTLLFEAMVLEYVKHMTVSVLARLVEENDKRLWRIIKHYVEAALALVDMSEVEMLGMYKTSKKGHNYITLVVDLKTHKVLFVTEGKDAATIDAFVKHFKAHSGEPNKVNIITCDMSLGFEAGVKACFQNAETIIDKFHVSSFTESASLLSFPLSLRNSDTCLPAWQAPCECLSVRSSHRPPQGFGWHFQSLPAGGQW